MQNILMYLSAFFMVFISCAVMCFCLRFTFWIYMEYWPQEQQRRRNRQRREVRERQRGSMWTFLGRTVY